MTEYTQKTLNLVAATDVEEIWPKDVSYGRSWKKRGGVGAFMMLARKIDRLETLVARHGYDVFEAVVQDGPESEQGKDGTVIAEIRDLRRYLLLVEAELVARGIVPLKNEDPAPEEGPSTDR